MNRLFCSFRFEGVVSCRSEDSRLEIRIPARVSLAAVSDEGDPTPQLMRGTGHGKFDRNSNLRDGPGFKSPLPERIDRGFIQD